MSSSFDLDSAIRKVPDFPHEGILFYDISSILTNPEAFAYCVEALSDYYRDKGLDAIAAVESRGFIFASPVALELGLPLVLIRKKGKLPGTTKSLSFKLEYGEDTIEVHEDDVQYGANILMVDDLIATGGTLSASCSLVKECGGIVKHICGVVALPFLRYAEKLPGYEIKTLVEYESENT